MIGLLCVSLLSSVVADVSLLDGQTFTGELNSIADETMVLVCDGEDRILKTDEIKQLKTPNASAATPPGRIVQLRDDSTLAFATFHASTAGKVEIATNVKQPVACSVDLVRSVRYFRRNKEQLDQWEEILASAGSDDYLVINKKSNLDYLGGTILSVDQEKVVFDYSSNTIDVPMERVAGLVFAKKPAVADSVRAVLTTTDGSVWQLREVRLADETLQLTSVGGATQQLPVSNVVSIEFIQAGVVYLSDLKPTRQDYVPYLESSVVGKSLRVLGLPRRDESFAGKPIRLTAADGTLRTFKRGLAVQSRAEMTYRLAGKYQRFQAAVGFDPDAPSEGHVEFSVFNDDAEVYQGSIAQGDPIVEIDLPVARVNRLRILVDYGDNLDIGDQLHLGDARFIE